jgi:hypothetical protein
MAKAVSPDAFQARVQPFRALCYASEKQKYVWSMPPRGDVVMSKSNAIGFAALLSCASVSVLPGLALAQDPEPESPLYTNCLYGFAVLFPDRPQQRSMVYPTNDGKVASAQQFYVEKGANRYSVTVVDYTNGPKADDQIVEHAATMLRMRGELFHQDFATYDPGMPGRQLNIFETKERQIRAAVYMAEHKLYIIEADAAPGDIPAVQFEQSITLVDEEGLDLDRIAPNGLPSPRQFKCR